MELLVYELQLKLMLREVSFEQIVDVFRVKRGADEHVSLKGGSGANRRRVRAVPAVA